MPAEPPAGELRAITNKPRRESEQTTNYVKIETDLFSDSELNNKLKVITLNNNWITISIICAPHRASTRMLELLKTGLR